MAQAQETQEVAPEAAQEAEEEVAPTKDQIKLKMLKIVLI